MRVLGVLGVVVVGVVCLGACIPQDFDADTPFFENISGRARASVAAAIHALKIAHGRENVSLIVK